MRAGAALALAAVIALGARTARGDGTARAEQLFQEAKSLVEKGSYAEACPKLEESQSLDPAVGTQFNLADCYEHVGRTASAYATFQEVARIARAAGKFEREKSAKERAEKLAPQLARVRVAITTEAPGLEVTVDGAPLPKEAWGVARPLDPGSHAVRATAPGHAAVEASVVATAGKESGLEIPALVDMRPKPKTVVQVTGQSPQRTIALVVGAFGVVGLGVGGVGGALSLSHRSKADSACPKDVYAFRCPTQDGTDEWNAATTTGNVSTVGFVAGGVLLAGAAVLWFTAPSPRTRVGLAASGLVLDGSF